MLIYVPGQSVEYTILEEFRIERLKELYADYVHSYHIKCDVLRKLTSRIWQENVVEVYFNIDILKNPINDWQEVVSVPALNS